MKNSFRILTINPGSTSTKFAVFDDEHLVLEGGVRYSNEELAPFATVAEQHEFRKDSILQALKQADIDIASLDAVVGRGGLLKPIASGVYTINDAMLTDIRVAARGEHAANLGAVIAKDIADVLHIPAYVVDPVVVDEMADIARFSGLPGYERGSIFHALNHKAIARRVAKEYGKSYDQMNLIVTHLGGGISVGIHRSGRVVDVNDALNGEGPFSPERSGSIPVKHIIKLCFSGKYTKEELDQKLVGKGGLVAYLGTNDGREVRRRIDAGDMNAKQVYEAMAYQVAKEIGAAATVLSGKIDAIVLTGGLAYDPLLVSWITERVQFIAPVKVFPGEDELTAMMEGGLRVLRGEEMTKEYQ